MTPMSNKSSRPKPVLLVILDGWGHSEHIQHNAIALAHTPTFDYLMAHYPHTLLQASGEAVGLPAGQMGNSEVGHWHIGAGRKVPQDLTRIDQAIDTGLFYQNPVLTQAIQQAHQANKAVHIVGLLSPGGVHSQEKHISALIELVTQQGTTPSYLHAILDGRDTPPRSATSSLERIAQQYQKIGRGRIASLIGRYYAMDRDQRWERTQKAYDLLTQGDNDRQAPTAIQGLSLAYSAGESDEFVKPTVLCADHENPVLIRDGDVVIFMNFRADRARQLTRAFTDIAFNAFVRRSTPTLTAFVTLTQYAKDIKASVAFPPLKMPNTLGEYCSSLGLHQLRIAETEKYAHVTYFFNAGIEAPFPGEDRLLIPSPPIATYDLKPAMSAVEITDQVIHAVRSARYDFIVVNYANPDMVGHTGNEQATQQAIEVIDTCLQRIIDNRGDSEIIITADHGNAEMMFDKKTGQPHTAHTTHKVPFLYIGRKARCIPSGALDDIAPTLLFIMGLTPPTDMTGHSLLQFM